MTESDSTRGIENLGIAIQQKPHYGPMWLIRTMLAILEDDWKEWREENERRHASLETRCLAVEDQEAATDAPPDRGERGGRA